MGINVGVYGLDHPHRGGHMAALDAVEGIDRRFVCDADATAAARQAALIELDKGVPAKQAPADPRLLPSRYTGAL